jgi:hypothetical protein
VAPRKPSQFHRWIALHPLGWAAIAVGVLVVGAGASFSSYDAFAWAVFVPLAVTLGFVAWFGAVVTRRMVERYDAG